MNSKLVDIIERICDKKVIIDEQTSLSRDLSFTSVYFVQLIVDIEGEFGFEFDDDEIDLSKLDCVGNLNNIISSHI